MAEKLRAGKIGIGYEVEQKMEQVILWQMWLLMCCWLCTDTVL